MSWPTGTTPISPAVATVACELGEIRKPAPQRKTRPRTQVDCLPPAAFFCSRTKYSIKFLGRPEPWVLVIWLEIMPCRWLFTAFGRTMRMTFTVETMAMNFLPAASARSQSSLVLECTVSNFPTMSLVARFLAAVRSFCKCTHEVAKCSHAVSMRFFFTTSAWNSVTV